MTNQLRPAAEQASEINLVPARIDFSTNLTQLTFASIVACVAAVAMYAPTALLHLYADDRLMHTIGQTLRQGNLAMGINVFVGAIYMNGKMHADRGPLGVLSLLIDRNFLGLNDHALHLGNILLQAICAVLIVQITAQLAASQRRSGMLAATAAVWAGIFYAVFPAAVGQLADIGGRGDMLANTFSLASIYLYLRFRTLRVSSYFKVSLLFCVLALFSATHAMIVPLVITGAEWLLFAGDRTRSMQRATFALPYWMALFFVATVSIAIPGYQPLNFGNMSASTPFGLGAPEIAVFVCYAVALLLMFSRVVKGDESWRPFAWCALWLVAGTMLDRVAVPSVQLHPYDKVAWAPMAIGIALCLVPALGNVRRTTARSVLAVGTAFAVVLCGLFGYLSLRDLQFWQDASWKQSQPDYGPPG
jgi:hypothetical protein